MDRQQAIGEAVINIVGEVEFAVLFRGLKGRTTVVTTMTPDRLADFLTVEIAKLDQQSRFRVRQLRRHEAELP